MGALQLGERTLFLPLRGCGEGKGEEKAKNESEGEVDGWKVWDRIVTYHHNH